MTKRELMIAQARFERGEQWHDGPALFNAVLADGAWLGIGTREELDALKADKVLPSEAAYQPVKPKDLI